MTSRPVAAAQSALYSIALLVGILLMPLALVVRRIGVALPVDGLIERLTAAYS